MLRDDLQFPDASIWSPDSRQIAYFWILGEGENQRSELRLIDLEGGVFKTLVKRDGVKAPYPGCWSKDGKTIWAEHFYPDENIEGSINDQKTWFKEIVRVSVTDGSVETVYPPGKRSIEALDISPDGQFLVFTLEQEDDPLKRDIHVLSTDGQRDMIVAQHSAHDWSSQWSVDGKQILFLSERTGSKALWAVSIENGQPVSEPILIQEGLPASISPLGISDAGIFYYSISSRMSDIYTAEMDLETGKMLSQPEKLKVGLEKLNYKPLWLPDGKTLVYMLYQADASQFLPPDTPIILHNIGTGQERAIHVEGLSVHPDLAMFYPTLTADGRALVVHRAVNSIDRDFAKINLDNGDVEVLKAHPLGDQTKMGYWPRLSKDSRILAYLSGDQSAIVIYDLISKEEMEIFRSDKDIYQTAFSPDLDQVVFRYRCCEHNELWLLSMEGGEPRLLGALEEGEIIRMPAWSPDGQYVLFMAENSNKLYRVRVDGDDGFQECELEMEDIYFPQIHPDGKRIAFTQFKGNYQEVWAMENFIPDPETEN